MTLSTGEWHRYTLRAASVLSPHLILMAKLKRRYSCLQGQENDGVTFRNHQLLRRSEKDAKRLHLYSVFTHTNTHTAIIIWMAGFTSEALSIKSDLPLGYFPPPHSDPAYELISSSAHLVFSIIYKASKNALPQNTCAYHTDKNERTAHILHNLLTNREFPAALDACFKVCECFMKFVSEHVL